MINIQDDFFYLQNLAGDDIKINGEGTYKTLINHFKTNRYKDLRTIASMMCFVNRKCIKMTRKVQHPDNPIMLI